MIEHSLKSKSWIFLKFLIVIFAFYSLHCWPFFELNHLFLEMLFFCLSLPFFLKPRYWDFGKNRIKIVIILEILLLYVSSVDKMNLCIDVILNSFPLVCVLFLKDKYLLDLFDTFQYVLVLILGVGSLFWILHLFSFDLPHKDISFGVVENTNGKLVDQYTFENHYFYLVNTSWMMYANSSVPTFFRYSSIFLEPGYLAILIMFILFINKFDLNDKRNYIYILSLVLTLSLAGYLLTLFAFVAHKLQFSRNRTFLIMGIGTALFANYVFFKNYNDGKNVINEAIIERLQYDEEKGISGNNRTSEAMDEQFNAFLMSSDVVWGIGNRKHLELGVGVKPFFVKNGIVGLAFFGGFLFFISKLSPGYRSSILMLLYILMFVRGNSNMFWTAFVLVYIAGVLRNKQDNFLTT